MNLALQKALFAAPPSKITLFFLLKDGDVEPYYLMLPRMSYLPLATEKVKKYFTGHADSLDPHKMWFDYKVGQFLSLNKQKTIFPSWFGIQWQ